MYPAATSAVPMCVTTLIDTSCPTDPTVTTQICHGIQLRAPLPQMDPEPMSKVTPKDLSVLQDLSPMLQDPSHTTPQASCDAPSKVTLCQPGDPHSAPQVAPAVCPQGHHPKGDGNGM